MIFLESKHGLWSLRFRYPRSLRNDVGRVLVGLATLSELTLFLYLVNIALPDY